ncbi:DUF3772 domain-containing protein [Cochlodiniinecator piscidefendens]|uniref:DUF3772 domain-containing protein n=1 Tax=Cochlodiniinecator piscidefendens TaxID=2715756 RepID=UPI001408D796|nr:DUF3772 domain-containing protein [Cochlodiniinecator piscidefendens]
MSNIRVIALCLFAVFATAFSPFVEPAVAQATAPAVDYTAWESTATRAQTAIAAGRASDAALEDLRKQLADWRAQFADAQSLNAAEITSLQNQISVLGPAPEDGSEPAEIATQRQTLTDQLAQARAPGQRATVAHSRASGLIAQIDTIIRERQTNKLLSLGPSPLNPVHWIGAFDAGVQFVTDIKSEISTAWNSQIQRTEFTNNLPATVILLVLAAVLLLRGRRWAERLSIYLQSQNSVAWRWLLGFVVSFAQVVVPVVGLVFLVEAFHSTGLIGVHGTTVIDAIPAAGFMFFAARWLGIRMFSRHDAVNAYLQLSNEQRSEARWYTGALGLLVGFNILIQVVVSAERITTENAVVLGFPVLVLVAFMTMRIGQMLISHYNNATAENTPPTYRCQVIRMIGRAVVAAMGVGVILAAIGYQAASEKLIFPTVLTLGLFALILILQKVVAEIYIVMTGNRETGREALLPVLIGFVLMLLAVPMLALIWGARVATLSELWTNFLAGVSVGGTTISPTIFLTFAVLFSIGYVLTRLIQGTLRNSLLPKTKLDTGGKNAIVSGTGYIGIFLAALIAITGAGINLSSLAIVAGALSVGIGFGLQNIVSNFVSGIILLIERPISEGDWIEVSGKSGYVRDISVRSTRIETFDRADVIVPNADLISGVVMNMTKGSLTGRVIVPIGVAYGSDSRQVEAILLEIAKAHPMVVLNPGPGVVFQGFGADSLNFEIRAILRDVNWMLSVKSDMNHEIARRFAEEGIEIPFAQRDVTIKNLDVLAPKLAKVPEAKPIVTPKDATEDVDFDASASPEEDSI